MTFFSRCEAPRGFEPGVRSSSCPPRPTGKAGGFRRALLDFLEDLGILARYAAGLDYYGRDQIGTRR